MVKTGEENRRAKKQTERQKQKNKRDGPKRSQKDRHLDSKQNKRQIDKVTSDSSTDGFTEVERAG